MRFFHLSCAALLVFGGCANVAPNPLAEGPPSAGIVPDLEIGVTAAADKRPEPGLPLISPAVASLDDESVKSAVSFEIIDALRSRMKGEAQINELTAAAVPSVAAQHQNDWILRPEILQLDVRREGTVNNSLRIDMVLKISLDDNTGMTRYEQSFSAWAQTQTAAAGDRAVRHLIDQAAATIMEELFSDETFRQTLVTALVRKLGPPESAVK